MTPQLHPALRWGLLATLGLSAWALVSQGEGTAVNVVEASPRPALSDASDHAVTSAVAPLPRRPELGQALRDPFARVIEQPAAPVPEPQPAVEVAAEPPPSPPAMSYRFLGRMTTPEGQMLVYLSKGAAAVSVSVGSELEDGYVVKAIREDSIDIAYPPTGAVLALQIPPQGGAP